MFTSGLTLAQHQLNNTCLTFLILDGALPGGDDDYESRHLAQTYCLETGVVAWPGLPKRRPIPLRDNTRLAEWEPMTAKRFAVIALDSGIAGADENVAGRIVHPKMAAVVISPSGFLMCWDENAIQVSDVGRLANVHQPLANRRDGWDEYYIHNDPEKALLLSAGASKGTQNHEDGWETATHPDPKDYQTSTSRRSLTATAWPYHPSTYPKTTPTALTRPKQPNLSATTSD